MTTVFRCDYSGTLGKLERTPQGGYRVPATIARVGVLEYGDGKGGLVREYNPPEVLAAALDSLRDAPVTNEHPPELVTAANYRKYAAGHVSGGAEFRDGMLHTTLVIQDAELIADIEAGTRREVSAGYRAHIDPTPGVTPQGEPYDAIRTRIDFNHNAIVRRGRAGSEIRLVIDSASGDVKLADSSTTATLSETMTAKLKIDGAEHAVESAQAVLDGAIAKRDSAVATAEGERDAAKARAEKAEAELAAAQVKLTEATAPAKIDALVTARLALVESARKVCGDKFDATGKTEAQIVAEVAAKAHPKLDLKDKSEPYVRALFDAALNAVAADPDGLELLRGTRVDASVKNDEKPVVKTDALSARAEMLAGIYDASKTKA